MEHGAGNVSLLRADARRIPLADESVDLVVTSPPYFGQRAYTDGGQPVAGQVGAEGHPREFLEQLWAITAECWRVLKPSGSMFVNLGDKRSGSGAPGSTSGLGGTPQGQRTGIPVNRRTWSDDARPGREQRGGYPTAAFGRNKSKQLIPHRYAIGCEDGLADPDGRGWIVRQELIWAKANGMPESVKDRCRDDFEMWFHLTKEGKYFSAVDELREPHADVSVARAQPHRADPGRAARAGEMSSGGAMPPHTMNVEQMAHPLGRLPGSVWTIPTDPLRWPAHLLDEDDNHYAAFPAEWPRRLITGWSPRGICNACGQGRAPVVDRSGAVSGDNNPQSRDGSRARNGYDGGSTAWSARMEHPDRIVGYACACPDTSAPTRPAVVLDPFTGTGTTVAVANALGRLGVGLDLSRGYLARAAWRITDPALRAKALGVKPPKKVAAGQLDLLGAIS
jgi:hypothetical protein